MNALLFLPGLCVVLFRALGAVQTLVSLAIIAGVQAILGAPFLLTNWRAYVSSAFDFSRVFLYKWTVNWRFLNEATFLEARTARVLLCAHAALLAAFGLFRWTGIGTQGVSWITRRWHGERPLMLTPACTSCAHPDIIVTLFTSNLIGVVVARSLHYQFYSWYAHALPLLCWMALPWAAARYVGARSDVLMQCCGAWRSRVCVERVSLDPPVIAGVAGRARRANYGAMDITAYTLGCGGTGADQVTIFLPSGRTSSWRMCPPFCSITKRAPRPMPVFTRGSQGREYG